MRFRRFSVLIVFFLFFPLIGFTLPQLAVLEAMLAAGIDPAAGPLITSKIEEEFVNSGKYRVLDRANIDEVLREKEFQLSSGIVRNEEIRQAGEYLGADFVVAVNVSRVGQTFVVAAKMIDVVSGEIAAQTSYERQGRIDVLLDIAKVVGGRLAGTEIVMIEVEEPKSEEPEKEEVVKATKVEPAARPQRERKPVEFKRFVVGVKAGGNLANIRWDDAYLYGDNP
jgi:TolB-like protein